MLQHRFARRFQRTGRREQLVKAKARRPRSLARRILAAFLVLLGAFALVSGFAVWSLGRSANEAELLRQAYLPLALSVRNLVLTQDTWNSQLNHVTATDNPADKRAWYDAALRFGRPKVWQEVELALDRALGERSEAPPETWAELSRELERSRELMGPDAALIGRLFEALDRGDEASAERVRDELVVRGLRVQKSLTDLEKRISSRVDRLVKEARDRQEVALLLLVVFASLSLLVGLMMALYARRALGPVLAMTRRAEAVAEGDLSQYPVIASNDEVGRLSETFEAMVLAISEARQRLVAAERLAAIGKLAAHVTHEVRNPLSSIGLNLDLLEDELSPQDTEGRALLLAIRGEVGRLVQLSDQYLSMARQTAPELAETDLSELVRAAVVFMRPDVERHGVRLELDEGSGLPWVIADAGQVRQVLYNLIRNAREALVDHGRISVFVRKGEASLMVSVEDDGPGVSEALRGRLFDPFFTTKKHGTGLGLAVTRQIVEAHGGDLRYEPREGGGSRFILSLRIRPAGSLAEALRVES
jgi:two-component system, NtrC family, sensor kinase